MQTFLEWAASKQNLRFFMPTVIANKRGHNSDRDKRVRWQGKHPGRVQAKHGRERGR
jgi:hypothetical protein